jgi:hypothetical protein
MQFHHDTDDSDYEASTDLSDSLSITNRDEDSTDGSRHEGWEKSSIAQ